MRGAFKKLLLILVLLLVLPDAANAALNITNKWSDTTNPVFYIDTGISAMYAAYQINDSSTSHSDIWVKIDNFTGGIVNLSTNDDGIVHLGNLSAGTNKTAFFHINASGATTSAQNQTIRIYDSNPGLPGATELANRTFTINAVEETLAASANKVTSVTTSPANPVLGGTVIVTVNGNTGVLGSSQILAFAPAAYATWPARKFELINTTITSSSCVPNMVDVLYAIATCKTNTAYTATYTFSITGTTTTTTSVSPLGYINSGGTNMKHTSTSNFATLAPIQPANNTVSMSMLINGSSSHQLTPAGGNVTYTLRFNNSDTISAATVESIIDTLPANVNYVSGSSKWNYVSIPDPDQSGSSLYWSGTFTIPASSSRNLTFQAAIPGTAGTYNNSAYAKIGTEQIDTTMDTSDNAPATSNATVLAMPTITKSFSPNSTTTNAISTITLTLNNSNTVQLTNVTFNDLLPTSPGSMVVATTPNASNACGGTLTATAGNGNFSLSGGTLSASGSCTVTVDVTAPTAGDYNNTIGSFSTTQTASEYTVTNATLSILPDTTKPTISYNPSTTVNNSILNITNSITVNVTAYDLNLKNITINLYNKTTGNLLNNQISSGVLPSTYTFQVLFTGLSNGDYLFNATAYDFSGNSNTTATRNVTILVTGGSDLNITSQNITFVYDAGKASEVTEAGEARENINLTINATIYNGGTSLSGAFYVLFYDGSSEFYNVSMNSVAAGGSANATAYWITRAGTHNITVKVDPAAATSDTDRSNNNASKLINVSAWQKYYGNATGNYMLANYLATSMRNWTWNNETNIGYLYVVNNSANINWSALHPLGYNKNNAVNSTGQDFRDADVNLGMVVGTYNATGFKNNNITDLFTNTSGSNYGNVAINKTTFVIFGNTINNVPVVNSTDMTNHNAVESANFVTGVLWDDTKDSNGYYDTTDNEDLVFITKIRQAASGLNGLAHNYEIAIPHSLNSITEGNVEMYMELI